MRETMMSVTHCGAVITATSGMPWKSRDYSHNVIMNILKIFELYVGKELYSLERFSAHPDEQGDIDGFSIRIPVDSSNEENYFGELFAIAAHSSWNGSQPINYEDINSFAINKYQFVRDWLMLVVEQFPEVPLTDRGKRFFEYTNFVEMIAEMFMPTDYYHTEMNYKRLMKGLGDIWSAVPYRVMLEPCAIIKLLKGGRPKTRLKNLIKKHVTLNPTEREVFRSTIKYIIEQGVVDLEMTEFLRMSWILDGLENENVINQ